MPRKHFFRATPKYRCAIFVMNGGFKYEGVMKSKRWSNCMLYQKRRKYRVETFLSWISWCRDELQDDCLPTPVPETIKL
jgi:hypothetical protein